MKLIAFGHRRRVGKDTAVKFAHSYLRSRGVKECARFSFFDQIKVIAVQLYGWGGLQDRIYYETHGDKKEEVLPAIGKSPRDIWIELGESINQICRITLPEMAFQGLPAGIHLCPDLRRPVEVEYIEKFNGITVLIERDSVEKSNDPVDCALDDYDGWKYRIKNNGNMKEFMQQIVGIIHRETGK